MLSTTFLRSVLVGLLATTQLVNGHTWIEQLMAISSNGTMVGAPGFPRGNVLRSNPSFSDPTMVNLIPPGGRPINQIEATDLMCKSSQTSQTQTGGSPRLQAVAGSAVALRYQENGHVTLPDNQPGKPPNRGTVYVYGTTQPSPDDSFLAIHRVWNAAGTGGDGRGKLLSTQNFDDGQCYQVNGGTISAQRQKQFPHQANSLMGGDLWCQQDIALPADAPSGKPYTLYWVWDWPTMPGTTGFPNGKQEIYTTCMDVDIVSSGSTQSVSNAAVNFAAGQDLDTAGISSELADVTNPTAVVGSSIAFGASATGPATGQAASESASAIASPGVDSTIPAFLSVHTTSTGGPGLETAVSVIPTTVPAGFTATTAAGQASAQSAQTQSSGTGNGRGGRNGGGRGGNGQATQTALTAVSDIPTGTATVNNQGAAPMETFTQFHSVFETVYQTVYNTHFTKRDAVADVTAAPATETASPSGTVCSKTEAVYRLKARLPFYPFRINSPAPTGC